MTVIGFLLPSVFVILLSVLCPSRTCEGKVSAESCPWNVGVDDTSVAAPSEAEASDRRPAFCPLNTEADIVPQHLIGTLTVARCRPKACVLSLSLASDLHNQMRGVTVRPLLHGCWGPESVHATTAQWYPSGMVSHLPPSVLPSSFLWREAAKPPVPLTAHWVCGVPAASGGHFCVLGTGSRSPCWIKVATDRKLPEARASSLPESEALTASLVPNPLGSDLGWCCIATCWLDLA